MNYKEAIKYLESFIDYEKRNDFNYASAIKLSRVRALLDGLGNPQKNFRSVHIAGTKGKGSICAFVYSMLKDGGIKAGLYTSPHLIDFKERIRISFPKDRTIDEAEIAALVARIKLFLDNFSKSSKFGPPSFFEVYTALAFLFFSIKKVEIAVIETGMGGRLDATNIIEPLVVGLAPISYDHTDKLGKTLESISKEKCGIIKEGAVVVTTEQDPRVMAVIKKAAADKKAALYAVGRDIKCETIAADTHGQAFNVRGLHAEYTLLRTPLLGKHQAANAAAAIGIVESLRPHGIMVCRHSITSGIRNVNWPGRLQVLGREPWIVLDGAQNEASARTLKDAVAELFSYKKLYLVFGVSSGKDIKGIAANLFPQADRIFLTRAATPRAIPPETVKKGLPEYEKKYTATLNVREAVELARREAKPEDMVLVTGSLFVVGEAMRYLENKAVRNEHKR
ncbi:MAG TPA: folylpolyglutamate synthase/dihydrofolate synthase family protein [Candidatus Omnitrophota bacterium]|nr:folylpolyglutamate synthase/dihydrofolate synthase family protein [Candidatus Omnitrophota bacterium]HPN66349.1 folylpolyglutamate synthase/dihydrofolate synthase family protein [Candidatus Omnitrophota bacterium]